MSVLFFAFLSFKSISNASPITNPLTFMQVQKPWNSLIFSDNPMPIEFKNENIPVSTPEKSEVEKQETDHFIKLSGSSQEVVKSVKSTPKTKPAAGLPIDGFQRYSFLKVIQKESKVDKIKKALTNRVTRTLQTENTKLPFYRIINCKRFSWRSIAC